ncbi:MAG TPA: rRNA maturation RNase YbeY [Pseudomonadales bacterium]|nr:rRNA maturation RNase YbeY [Pseudomonadales bacterium]
MKRPNIAVQIPAGVDSVPRATELRRWARAALQKVHEAGNMCIRIVGTDEMADLNARFRKKKGATNVLSFGADIVIPDGDERWLGDVVICAPVVAAEAAEQHKSIRDHYAHLVVHGVLHLCGCDHEEPAEAEVMERLEVAILKTFSIDDPYR